MNGSGLNRSGIILYWVFICHTLHGQTLFDTFPLVPNLDNQAQAWSIYAEENGFSILGDLLDTSGQILPWIGSYDYNGLNHTNFILKDTHQFSALQIGTNRFEKLKNGNYILAGRQRNEGNIYEARLVEVEPFHGEIIRSEVIRNTFDSSVSIRPRELFCLDSSIVLTGFYNEDSRYVYVITFLDYSFSVQKQFIITDSIYKNFVYSFNLLPDGRIALVGNAVLASDQSNFRHIQPFLHILSHTGESLYINRYSGFGDLSVGLAPATSRAVRRSENGDWILSCVNIIEHKDCFNCFEHVPYTFALDSNFVNLLWLQTYDELSPNDDDQPRINSMVRCADGSGYVSIGAFFFSFIYKVNADGSKAWLRHYQPMSWEPGRALWTELVDIRETPEGNLLMCGRVSDRELGIIRPWVIQLDREGCLVPGCHIQNAAEDERRNANLHFTIFPNPVASDLGISCDLNLTLPIQVSLVSTEGVVLQSREMECVQNVQYVFPIGDLPAGTYHVILRNRQHHIHEVHTFVKP